MRLFKILIVGIVIALIFTSCTKQKTPFEKAKEMGTIEAFEIFITENPASEFIKNAEFILDSLRYEKITSSDSVSVFESFISNYPKSRFVENAKEQIINLNFIEAKANNSISSYETFIKKYPDCKFVEEAETILDSLRYFEVKNLGTLEKFRNFLKKYPNSTFLEEVKEQIDKLTFTIKEIKPTIKGYQNRAIVKMDKVGDDKSEKVVFCRKGKPGYELVVQEGGIFCGSDGSGGAQIGSQGETKCFGTICVGLEKDKDFFGNLDYDGSVYTFEGTVRFLGYTFISDSNKPLVFKLDSKKGFDYISGDGKVITKEGKQIQLGK